MTETKPILTMPDDEELNPKPLLKPSSSLYDDKEKLCEICVEQDKHEQAMRYCRDCKEFLCDHCAMRHKSQKYSRNHDVIDKCQLIEVHTIDDQSELCEPCFVMGMEKPSSMFCTECEEKMCENCSDVHKSQKMTKLHKVITMSEYYSATGTKCEPCTTRNLTVDAVVFCKDCEEDLCEGCKEVHKSQKATRMHKLIDIGKKQNAEKRNVQNSCKKCEPCAQLGEDKEALNLCRDCKEYLCMRCSTLHEKQKATRSHKLVKLDEIPEEQCSLCLHIGEGNPAVVLCNACPEKLCEKCAKIHATQKATKDHKLQELLIPDFKDCNSCSGAIAVHYCESCLDFYCESCGLQHKSQKATGIHKLVDASLASNHENRKLIENDEEEKVKEKLNIHGSETPTEKRSDSDDSQTQVIPGKPTISDVRSDSVTLHWEVPDGIAIGSGMYQIRYKEENQKHWTFYGDGHDRANITIKGLKCDSAYVFQVRALLEDIEGPYGPVSEKVTTRSSLASQLLPYTAKIKDGQPSKHKIQSTENVRARNTQSKTRKFELGKPPSGTTKEKTILLVGATGSGKSTLVDGIINYVTGVNWKDPFRFTLVDLEEDEKNKNQAVSQTEWITCYTINPEEGSRLDYRLNIIDTPGFGDTRGLDRDNEIVHQLRELFSSPGEKGVVFIDAVCFLIKAPDARLTATQKYIFMSILSLFGQDIKENICTLITFADGQRPPVLDAMKEADLPSDTWYVFNNSGLFADNKSSLAPMFWQMGIDSFRKFFSSVEKLSTKSLQQTKEVLQQRQRLEVTICNLQPQVDAGLNKLHELRQEIEILKKHEKDIIDNKDFEYEVDETKQVKTELPKGRHVTNCLHCNITCHDNCAFANDEDKRRCCVMDGNGYCTFCDNKCFWKQHHNTPYIFTYTTHKVKKTYTEKMKLYQKAGQDKVTHEQVIEGMKNDLDDLTDTIECMMEEVSECNRVLKEIALHPNPLTMVEHIDIMIESEKREKKEGFIGRIKVLEGYRKRAEIHKDVDKLKKDLTSTVGGRQVLVKKKGKRNVWSNFKGLFGY